MVSSLSRVSPVGHAAMSRLNRSQGIAVHVSVRAWPNERTIMTTRAAVVSSGASNRSR
jgi:hypothetical protein